MCAAIVGRLHNVADALFWASHGKNIGGFSLVANDLGFKNRIRLRKRNLIFDFKWNRSQNFMTFAKWKLFKAKTDMLLSHTKNKTCAVGVVLRNQVAKDVDDFNFFV